MGWGALGFIGPNQFSLPAMAVFLNKPDISGASILKCIVLTFSFLER